MLIMYLIPISNILARMKLSVAIWSSIPNINRKIVGIMRYGIKNRYPLLLELFLEMAVLAVVSWLKVMVRIRFLIVIIKLDFSVLFLVVKRLVTLMPKQKNYSN